MPLDLTTCLLMALLFLPCVLAAPGFDQGVTIQSINVTSLWGKLSTIFETTADIMILQETQLVESAITTARRTARTKGWNFWHGTPCAGGVHTRTGATASGGTKGGVAIAAKRGLAVRQIRPSPTDPDDAEFCELFSTERIIHVSVNAGSGMPRLHLVGVYGLCNPPHGK